MFGVGDKILCIDDSMAEHTRLELSKDVPNWVKKGEEYTIREVYENKGIVLGILLEEISNPVKFFKLINRFQEPAFADWRFRLTEKAPFNFLEEEGVNQGLELETYEYLNYKISIPENPFLKPNK